MTSPAAPTQRLCSPAVPPELTERREDRNKISKWLSFREFKRTASRQEGTGLKKKEKLYWKAQF